MWDSNDGAVLFSQFNGFLLLDLCFLNQLSLLNIFIFDITGGQNTLEFDFSFSGNLCFFCFTFFAGFLSGNFSQLFSTANGNFTFLLQLGIFFFTNNLQARLFSFQIFGFDRQIGILFNVVTLAATIFNGFSELGQTFSIKCISLKYLNPV
ncbi:hypothetical protein F4T82_12380 [Acinetobacter lwoffii]|nr:hypothetical protein [Acinetobacter lwoffii]